MVALGIAHQHTDPPHTLGLLRARGAWPADGRAAKERNELAPPHWLPPQQGEDR